MDGDLYTARLDALAGTWARWADLGHSLGEGDWAVATRCTGWDVACLYAHHSQMPLALGGTRPQAGEDPGAVVLTAAEILRRFNVPEGPAHTMAGHVADQAADEAGRVPPAELVARFEGPAQEAIRALRRADPPSLVPWPATAGLVTVEEAIRIVLLEAVVHFLDVTSALGRSPELPDAALGFTACLLAEVPPAIEFIDAATGRRTSSPLPVLR